MAKSDQVIRFAVGDPAGRRSAVYRVWAPQAQAGMKNDVYVALRRMGQEFKVSFHGGRVDKSPRAHQSISAEMRETIGVESRFLHMWDRLTPESDFSPEFEIIVLASELSYEPEREDDFAGVTWIPAPPAEGLGQVCLVFGHDNQRKDWPGKSFRNSQLLGRFALSDGMTCWAVVLGHLVTPSNFRAQIDAYKAKLPSARPSFELNRPPIDETGTRVLLNFARDGRYSGWIEMSFVSDPPAV